MSFSPCNLTLDGFHETPERSPNETLAPKSFSDYAISSDGDSVAPRCTFCCCSLLCWTTVVLLMASIAFAVVIGNAIALTVFLRTRQCRTPQLYLKVSLALADIIVGILVIPFSVYTEITLMVTRTPSVGCNGCSYDKGPTAPWQPCMVIGIIFTVCTFVSIITIFLMTLERAIAILRPLHKDSVITRPRTLRLIVISWAGSFLLAIAPLLFSNAFTLEYNRCSCMCNYALIANRAPAWNVMLLFPIFDFALLGASLVINVLSFTTIRHYSHKRKFLAKADKCAGAQRPSFSDIKAAKTISILTIAFTASFTPIAVFVLGNVVGYTWCTFSFFAFWILTSNSCCNVIIYSFRDKRFRHGVQQLFLRTQPTLWEKN
ncbi:adenosine receptor A1-like [Ambystoma mexicanum]|uniref:adenosine receptor A1-like n=1 Tax=Ambystoma mexicanum TaxID=8296 RepID=UPI0037E82053